MTGSTVSSPAAAPPSTDGGRRQVRPLVAQQLQEPERYRIIGEHGRGGLGCVSRAHDQELGRDVAIKEVIARDAVSEARFVREALITARLEHPGIVPVYEAGRWPDGTPFYAMKLVAGRPLRELIRERATVDERIALLHHVIAVADAMAYAHDQGIIHRDLKPANVIVGDFGETIVIDWGLAKDLAAPDVALAKGSAPSPSDDHLTATGCVVGTPAYMAPEQARGDSVDQRADVFAIGAMLWELCSLQKVPPDEPHLRHRLLRRAGIDQDLITIVDKTLAREPERRYPHAGALAVDLKAFKSGARIMARSYSLVATLAHWTRRHRALALSMLIVVVLIVSSAIALAVLYHDGLQTHLAKQAAELAVTRGEIEQGRQALLQDESAEALPHLVAAYKRGDRSSGTAFMLARTLQARSIEQAQFASISGRMWSAVFSPDGLRIVATDDGGARVWDANSHHPLFTLPHEDVVYQATYTTDGTRIITACADGVVRIWDAASGALKHRLTPGRGWAEHQDYFALATSPDDAFVAAIDSTGQFAHVWALRAASPVAELVTRPLGFPSVTFSSDGRWVATSGGEEVRIFDTSTWTQSLMLPGPSVRALAFAPKEARLLTGNADGDVSLWEVPSGKRLRQFREHGETINDVAVSPDGEFIATASYGGALQIWNAASGKLQTQINHARGRVSRLEFDATSKLVLATAGGVVVVADAILGTLVAVLDGARSALRTAHFDPSSRLIVGASWDGSARVWRATSPYRSWSSSPIAGSCGSITSLEPDRRFLAVGCWHHDTQIWDTARGELLAELPSTNQFDADVAPVYPAVTTNGDRAAIARDNTVEIYAIPGGHLIREIVHPGRVLAVAFAATGYDLVSGSLDGSLFVTHDDRAPIPLPTSGGRIDTAAFLPDRRIVATDANRRLRIYSPDGHLLADLAAPHRARPLRISPRGDRLLTIATTAGKPLPPVLWDLERYRSIGPLEGHVGPVWSAQFVAENAILTAGHDGTARLWDASSGQLRQTYRGNSRFLTDATLDPSGAVVVAGAGDGVLWCWDLSSGQRLWSLPAQKPYVAGVHFEGDDLVTRGFGGEVTRWKLPKPAEVIADCLRQPTCPLR